MVDTSESVWRTSLLMLSKDGATDDEGSFFFAANPLDHSVRCLGECSAWCVARSNGVEFKDGRAPCKANICFGSAVIDFGMDGLCMQRGVEIRIERHQAIRHGVSWRSKSSLHDRVALDLLSAHNKCRKV